MIAILDWSRAAASADRPPSDRRRPPALRIAGLRCERRDDRVSVDGGQQTVNSPPSTAHRHTDVALARRRFRPVLGRRRFHRGLQSRRLPVLAVAFWSQLAGALLLALVLLVRGEPLVSDSVTWGLAAGLCGMVGLLCFYRGLAIGTMSLVALIGACGALVPVIFGLVRGEQPLAAALGDAGGARRYPDHLTRPGTTCGPIDEIE